jgi:hypothetical protein
MAPPKPRAPTKKYGYVRWDDNESHLELIAYLKSNFCVGPNTNIDITLNITPTFLRKMSELDEETVLDVLETLNETKFADLTLAEFFEGADFNMGCLTRLLAVESIANINEVCLPGDLSGVSKHSYGKIVRLMKNITKLTIIGVRFSVSEAQDFAESLRGHSYLKEFMCVKLPGIEFQPETYYTLETIPTLMSVSLHNHRLEHAAPIIARLLTVCPNIAKVDMACTEPAQSSLDSSHFTGLLDAAKESYVLKKFTTRFHPLRPNDLSLKHFETEMARIVRLNSAGRIYMQTQPTNTRRGYTMLGKVSDDLNCLFVHLRENPALCDWQQKSKAKPKRGTKRKAKDT